MGHEFRIGVFAVCLLSTPVAVQAQVLDLDDPLDRSGRYENLFTVNADNGWRLTFTGELGLNYNSRPDYTAITGAARDGFDRLTLRHVYWGIADYQEIGDPFWTELVYNGVYAWQKDLGTDDVTVTNRNGASSDLPYAGLSAVVGSGNFYLSATNGPTLYGGPGNGMLGIYRRALYVAGGYDTYWRANGARTHAQETVLATGDLFNMARFTDPDGGGGNGELYFGLGHVSEDTHYGLQVSDNGAWASAWAAGRLVGPIGYGVQVVGVDSTNNNGRAVRDWGFDSYLGYSDARTEYALNLGAHGLGESPVWNLRDSYTFGVSSTVLLGDAHTLGGLIEFSRDEQINATTGVYLRDRETRRYQIAYSYNFDLHTRLLANLTVTDVDVTAGSFAGGSQFNTDFALTLRWDY
jgi:hypothetical protein